jgi:hypothetical protein
MNAIARLRGAHKRTPRPRTVDRLVQGVRAAWRRILALVAAHLPPESPQPSPPLAKAAALREGALLSEHVDARSRKQVA